MYRLMMVDDQRLIMEGIQQIMREDDLPFDEYLIVESGEEALSCLESFCPDAIITDIRMPGMDGIALIKNIRCRQDSYRDIPIVILSGYNEFEYAKQAIAGRVIYYLLKPVQREELYSAFHTVCDRLVERTIGNASPLDLNRHILRAAMNGEPAMDVQAQGPFLLAQFLPQTMDEAFRGSMRMIVATWRERLLSVYERERDIICLIKGSQLFAEDQDEAAEKNISLPENAQVNLSLSLQTLEQLPEALRQVRLVHLRRPLLSKQTVVSYADISASDRPPSLIRFDDMRVAFDAISAGDEKALAAHLVGMRQRLMSDNATFEYVCAYYGAFCMELYKRYYSLGLLNTLGDVFNFLLHSASVFSDLPDAERVAQEAERHILSLCEKLLASGERNLALLAKNYIDEHPETNLAQVAERLNVSSQYLSAFFHKETGQPFSSYLIDRRIDKAKRLLETTTRPVSEIGRNVGYASEKHFFVVFKRITGKSPAKYRQTKRLEYAKK